MGTRKGVQLQYPGGAGHLVLPGLETAPSRLPMYLRSGLIFDGIVKPVLKTLALCSCKEGIDGAQKLPPMWQVLLRDVAVVSILLLHWLFLHKSSSRSWCTGAVWVAAEGWKNIVCQMLDDESRK